MTKIERQRFIRRNPWLRDMPLRQRKVAYETLKALESVGITEIRDEIMYLIKRKAKSVN